MDAKIHDKELGTILLKVNPRARHYSIRINNGLITAVMPVGGNVKALTDFINEKRAKLKEILQKPVIRQNLFDETTELQTNTFKLRILRSELEHFHATFNDQTLLIACPKHTDFGDNRVQLMLKKYLKGVLSVEAKRVLPGRLQVLAKQYGFTYSHVKIANTKSRWGSCSTKKNINLSVALMLLPDPLINYVLLHELCHTREMNHSDRFWDLMNRVTDNRALTLRKELKNYSTHVF
jgi:predicted metal-dependent hydrolase